jgi:hypothetical protein
MVKHNPQLAKKNKKEVQTLYTTLHNISPDLAKDPVVANSWVNRMMYTDSYVDPKTISDLTSAQSKMQRRTPEIIQSFNKMVPSLAGSMAKDPNFFKKPTGYDPAHLRGESDEDFVGRMARRVEPSKESMGYDPAHLRGESDKDFTDRMKNKLKSQKKISERVAKPLIDDWINK